MDILSTSKGSIFESLTLSFRYAATNDESIAAEEMYAITIPESRVYSPYGTRSVRNYRTAISNMPAKEIKQELFPSPWDDLREAHMKLDPLQDIYPKKGRYKKVHLDFVLCQSPQTVIESQTPTCVLSVKKPSQSQFADKPKGQPQANAHCVMSRAHKFDLKAYSSRRSIVRSPQPTKPTTHKSTLNFQRRIVRQC